MSILFDETDEAELLDLLLEEEAYIAENSIDYLYPDRGSDGNLHGFRTVTKDIWNPTVDGRNYSWTLSPTGELQEPINPSKETWSRHLYPQQLDFFKQGVHYNYRLLIAANQVGKSLSAGCEVAYHATGEYPHWWEGIRYQEPPRILISGVDTDSMRKVIQKRLLGPVGRFGTGLIRKSRLDFFTLTDAKKSNTLITTFLVQHSSGGFSEIELKSYASGVQAFYGFQADLVWLDEEPPIDIFEECKTRMITTGGKMMITFTPLKGVSSTIEAFMGSNELITGPIIAKDGTKTSKYVVRSTWMDVPHITYSAMKEQLDGMPEYLRDAKSKGIPSLGDGAVYPFRPEQVFIDPFAIPRDWKRAFAMDFGWEDPTAVLWMAINPDTKEKFIYSEHYQNKTPMAIHAQAIKQRDTAAGYTIPGVCDPSGGGRSGDGKLTKETYRNEFTIKIQDANNSLAPGIQIVINEFIAGTLKIFSTCTFTKGEFTKYRYEKGKLKGADHLMDCLRYIVVSGTAIADGPPALNNDESYLPSYHPRY